MTAAGTAAKTTPASSNWTVWLGTRVQRTVPRGQWLPDRQPVYVASWIYVFGVATLAAFVVVLASGGCAGPRRVAWWHTSTSATSSTALHLWSVELFFVFMVIHLWGKFWMAAWRGKRALTWVTGAVAFLGSIGTAFTGYLVADATSTRSGSRRRPRTGSTQWASAPGSTS